MTNKLSKITKDKIKLACKLHKQFGVERGRLICKICKTFISVTTRTSMGELDEHFKTVVHLKSINPNAVKRAANGSVSIDPDAGNSSENPESEGNDSMSSVAEINDTSDGGESNFVDNEDNTADVDDVDNVDDVEDVDNVENVDNADNVADMDSVDIVDNVDDFNNVNPVFPTASAGPAANKNVEKIDDEDNEMKCEYEKLKSTNRSVKQEPGVKPCIDFLPANQLFYTDLIQLCLATNISFTKLTGSEFRSFFQKHFNTHIPDWNEIRTHFLKPMYETKMHKLKALVSSHNIYLIVKQHWCDGRGNVVSLLVGPLDGKPTRSYLYKISVMKNVDLTILSQEIIAILHNLYQGLAFDKLSLLITDNCPLSIQTGNFLKTLFPKLRHVICLMLTLESYVETFRLQHKLLNEYISTVNSIFDLSPNLSSQFKSTLDSINFPLGCSNLYGAQWMESVEVFAAEFTSLISILSSESTDDIVLREKMERLNSLFDNKELQDELIDFNGYRSLREAINLLESNIYNLPQMRRKMEMLGRNPKRSALIAMVKETMWKNPDLEEVLNLAEDLNSSDGENPGNNSFKYAPLCVTDSSKCFKLFKSMLDENAEISDQDLETLTFLAYNQDL